MTLSLYGLKEWLLATIIAAVLAAVAIAIGWWWIAIVVHPLVRDHLVLPRPPGQNPADRSPP